jgi:O-antigen ligase
MGEYQETRRRVLTWGFFFLFVMLPFCGFISPKSASVVVPFASLVIIIGYVWTGGIVGVLRSRVWIAIATFMALIALSLLWAPDKEVASERVFKLMAFFPIGIALCLIANQSKDVGGDNARKALLFGFGIGVALLAWAVLTAGGLFALLNPDVPYLEAPAGNNRGAVILVLLATATILAARRLSWQPWLWTSMAGLAAILLFAASQTALMGFLVWGMVFGAAIAAPSLTRSLVIWGGAAFILAQPFLVLGIEALDPGRSVDISIASVGARLDIWIAVAHKTMEAPFFGHGIEATRSITDWANEFLYFGGRKVPHPHNGILQIWIELGLVGAILAALIWVTLTRGINRFVREDQPVLFALAACFLVITGISHGVWQSWWVWGVFGVAAVTLTQLRQDVSTPS